MSGLNDRGVLADGRRTAYGTAEQSVELWRIATDKGQHGKAAEIVKVAWNRPFADVLAATFHQAAHRTAGLLFLGEEETLELSRDRDLRAAFLSRVRQRLGSPGRVTSAGPPRQGPVRRRGARP